MRVLSTPPSPSASSTPSTSSSFRPLPPGWRWVKLGEVCDASSGAWGADEPFAGSMAVTVLGVSNVTNSGGLVVNGAPTRYLANKEIPAVCQEGDLLVVKSSGSATNIRSGKTGLCPKESDGKIAVSNFMIRLVVRRELADSYLLWLMLNSEDAKAHVRLIAGSTTYPNIKWSEFRNFTFPLPPLHEQKRIARILNEQMAEVEKARAATEAQLEAAKALPAAYLRESFATGKHRRLKLGDCLEEVRDGVGPSWQKYPVLGATRAGIAPAKEAVGKKPERYKLADAGTVFYNSMRILLGSIALVDEGDEPGITSPDYVVFKGRRGCLDARWFYYWLRSESGAAFIRTLARGAVRERIMFPRLAEAEIELPDWRVQQRASHEMKGVRDLMNQISAQTEVVNRLPAVLLRKAFRGEL